MADARDIDATPVASGRRALCWIAWLAGAALIIIGVLCVGVYVGAVAEAWGSSDRSVIYWALVLPGLGVALIGVGGLFVAIGFRARRGDSADVKVARYSLAALAILVVVAVLAGYFREQRWAQERRERAQTANLHDGRLRDARRIEGLDLDVVDNRRLAIRVDLGDGLDGFYRWTLALSDDQVVFHQESRLLRLDGQADPVTRELTFDTVFADCFAGQPPSAYVCVKGAGAEEVYTVSARLELVEDARGAVPSYERRHAPVVSTAAADLQIDTMTTPHAVTVKHVRKL